MQLYADVLSPSVLIGVGAAFDYLSGSRRRAPNWMRCSGLEWLHRLVLEPRRLTRRYITTNSEFVLRAGRELLDRRGRERC